VGSLWSSLFENGLTDFPQIFTEYQAYVGGVPFAIRTLIASLQPPLQHPKGVIKFAHLILIYLNFV